MSVPIPDEAAHGALRSREEVAATERIKKGNKKEQHFSKMNRYLGTAPSASRAGDAAGEFDDGDLFLIRNISLFLPSFTERVGAASVFPLVAHTHS